jgi:hypothetical protein
VGFGPPSSSLLSDLLHVSHLFPLLLFLQFLSAPPIFRYRIYALVHFCGFRAGSLLLGDDASGSSPARVGGPFG